MSNSLHFNVKTQSLIYYIDSDFIYCGCQYSLITLFHIWSLMNYLWVMMWEICQDEKMMIPIFLPAMTFQYYELYLTRLGLYDLFCCTHYPLIPKQRPRERKEYILKGLWPWFYVMCCLEGQSDYSLTFQLKTQVVS